MSNYTAFAEFYDQLTDNVDYATNVLNLLQTFGASWSYHGTRLWIWLAEQAA